MAAAEFKAIKMSEKGIFLLPDKQVLTVFSSDNLLTEFLEVDGF